MSADRSAHRRSESEILRKHEVPAIREALRRLHNSEPRTDLALAGVLFRMERYDDGESLLRRTPAREGDQALRCFMLGNFAVKRGDRAAAVAEFSTCVQHDPAFAPAYNNLGVLAAGGGRGDEARGRFLKALDARPGYADPRRNLAALDDGASDGRWTWAPLRPVLRLE